MPNARTEAVLAQVRRIDGNRCDPVVEAVSVDGSAPQQASQAAAKLLEIAARDADSWRAQAKAEGDALVAAAKADAESRVRAGQAEADRLTTSARVEADRVLGDARAEAQRILAELATAKNGHDVEVARLQQMGNDSRERLRSQLTAMLAQVDQPAADGV